MGSIINEDNDPNEVEEVKKQEPAAKVENTAQNQQSNQVKVANTEDLELYLQMGGQRGDIIRTLKEIK